MKNLKKLITSSVSVITLLAIIPLAAHAEWRHNEYYAPYSGHNIETWNYYENDGKPKEGWFSVDGKWYYGDEEHEDDYYGIYIDEWAPAYYKGYVDSSRVFHTDYGAFDYYCGSDGAMKTGWFQAYPHNNEGAGLHWYYAGSDGKILRNTHTPDGYWVNSDGIWK